MHNEEKFRLLFSKANDAIFILDKGILVDCNERAYEMFRATEEDFIGKPPTVLFPPTQPNGKDSAQLAQEYIDLYFERHDGTAATCDDFVDAMAAASGRDLSAFRRWYGQAGTPTLAVETAWDADAGALDLTLRQERARPEGERRGRQAHDRR